MFTSYAQNFEDVILWRALRHVKGGFYIDIGAQDPVDASLSLGFYERGWRGVHVEPSAQYAEKLRKSRPDEEVMNLAIGNREATIDFFEIPNTGLSTGSVQIAEQHRKAGFFIHHTRVDCLPLSNLLGRFGHRDIHWLKIDVEGMEETVIDGWGSCEVRPWIVVVESVRPLTRIDSNPWEEALIELGYDPVYSDGLNRFFLSARHDELRPQFRFSPNIFDDFVFGLDSTAQFCSLFNQELKSKNLEILKLESAVRVIASCAEERSEFLRRLNREHDEMLNSERALLKYKLRMEQKQTSALRRELDRLLHKMPILQHDLESHRAVAVPRLERELQDMQVAFDNLQYRAGLLQEQLNEVYASRSWRITRPIRSLKSGLNMLHEVAAHLRAVSASPEGFVNTQTEQEGAVDGASHSEAQNVPSANAGLESVYFERDVAPSTALIFSELQQRVRSRAKCSRS